MAHDTDVAVIGAGIVGVSAALHLVRRGFSVTLIDRGGPGEETSYGNAGVIEGGAFLPVAMPRTLAGLLPIALNRSSAVHHHPSFLPRAAPWIARFYAASSQARRRRASDLGTPLFARAIAAHKALMSEANALSLLRETGWLRLYRDRATFEAEAFDRETARQHGVAHDVLGTAETIDLEPHLRPVFSAAVYWRDIASVSNPLRLTQAYAGLFASRGGRIVKADVRALTPLSPGWRIEADAPLVAGQVVVAAGPWSMDLIRPLGYAYTFAVKRGYHLHFSPQGNAGLSRPVVDDDFGFVLAPMEQGIRLTTGVEIADRDAPPTPVQIGRVSGPARALFPLGEPVEDAAWMGRRPCFADSLPAVGKAPGHDGLWFDFGHAHHGLTLGPVTGELLAQLMRGDKPIVDPAALDPARLG